MIYAITAFALGVALAHPIRYWLAYWLAWLGIKILWLKTPLWLLSQWVAEDTDEDEE